MRIKTEVKIGLIVLATIVLVIWGINYLKGKNVLKRSDVFYAVFSDVSGLNQSGTVFLNGMKVGVINSIALHRYHKDLVEVAFAVNKGIKIPVKSRIELFSSDIMGNKALRIIPSLEQKYIIHGDTLESSREPDMFKSLQEGIRPFTDQAEKTLTSLDSLITAVNLILNPATQEKLRQSIANLEKTTGAIASELSAGGKLNMTLTNLESFSASLKENRENLNRIFSNLGEISDTLAQANLKSAIANMNATFDQTQQLLAGINKGNGSLGLLATNDSLYNNLKQASANLASLLDDLEKNPKRYVHFSVFGKKDKSK